VKNFQKGIRELTREHFVLGSKAHAPALCEMIKGSFFVFEQFIMASGNRAARQPHVIPNDITAAAALARCPNFSAK
jgi:hypothetical protein